MHHKLQIHVQIPFTMAENFRSAFSEGKNWMNIENATMKTIETVSRCINCQHTKDTMFLFIIMSVCVEWQHKNSSVPCALCYLLYAINITMCIDQCPFYQLPLSMSIRIYIAQYNAIYPRTLCHVRNVRASCIDVCPCPLLNIRLRFRLPLT